MDSVTLQHPLFGKLKDVLFRLTEGDGVPALATTLGDRTVLLPLDSLVRELDLPTGSPDLGMLDLIGRALDFVHELKPGDPLPGEVVGGGASWEPDPTHVALAATRLQLRLVAWVAASSENRIVALGDDAVRRAMQDPGQQAEMRSAVEAAAGALGVTPEAALALVQEVAYELAFVEALRDRLLQQAAQVATQIDEHAARARRGTNRLETLVRLRKLMEHALKLLRGKFEEADRRTEGVLGLLRTVEANRAAIRADRDWLYCTWRAWQPLLEQWRDARAAEEEAVWQLILRTYRFLAPRYTPVQQWRTRDEPVSTAPKHAQMLW